MPGLEILELRELYLRLKGIHNHDPFDFHRLDFYLILICEGKSIAHRVDFNKVSLDDGEALIISPGQVHAFELTEDSAGYILLLNEPFLLQYIAPKTLEQLRPLFNYFFGAEKSKLVNDQLNCILEIEQLMQQESPFKAGLVGAALSIFFLHWLAQKSPQLSTSDQFKHSHFEQFRTLLEQHYTQSRDAGYYAQALGLTYTKLNELCKSLVQLTAKRFIDLYVVLEVKRLLISTQKSVKEITFQIGFDDVTNFIKYFKRHTGQTPRQFRDLRD